MPSYLAYAQPTLNLETMITIVKDTEQDMFAAAVQRRPKQP